MLQLYVHGKVEEGFLDISPDAQLSMEYFSDLFDDTFSNGQFSLPVDIPLTDNNRKILGFAERISNSAAVNNRYWIVDIYEDNWPLLTGTKMSILTSSVNWGYTRGKISVTITGVKGLFGTVINKKKLADLTLGGVIQWHTQESRDFATDHKNGLYPHLDYIIFTPIAIEDFIDTAQSDYTTEFLVRDTVNDMLLKLVSPGVYKLVFNRVDPTNNSAVIAAGNLLHIDYRTVPFFKLKYVLQHCFTEFGYTVTGDFIDNTDFDKLFIFNNYSLEVYSMTTYTDYNNLIIPANHVPDMYIVDFLKAIFTFFNIFPSFDGSTNTVTLNYRKNSISSINAIDITDKVLEDIEVTETVLTDSSSTAGSNMNTPTGYTLEYEWGGDNYGGDRVKDKVLKDGKYYVGDKELIGTICKHDDLVSFTYIRQLTTSDCIFIKDMNLYYSVADATVTPILWECYAEALNSYIYGDGSKSINVGLSTLCKYILLDPTDGLNYYRGILGAKMKGSYTTNKGNRITNPFGLKIFYAEYSTGSDPAAISYNGSIYDTGWENIPKVKYDLDLNSDMSIGKIFHYDWQVKQINQLVVKTTILTDTKVLNDLRTYSQVIINGVLFMVYKIEQTTPTKGSMVVYLVPL